MLNRPIVTQIKALSFDGDGTLWDFEKVMRHSLQHVLIELKDHVTREQSALLSIEKMIQIRNEVAQEYKGRIINLEDVRYKAFQRILKFFGVKNDELAHELNEIYLKHRFEDIELYEDVITALDALAGSYKIGLLSNGNNYPDRCGLEGYFSFVIFSQDHGVEKPDRRLFDIALEKAACNPDELMHIGDSLESDIKGAKDSGILSVLLNRDSVRSRGTIEPDYEIDSLECLIPILNSI